MTEATYTVFKAPAPTGWVCPVCGAANAPWVSQCPCRNGGYSYTPVPYLDPPPMPEPPFIVTCHSGVDRLTPTC